MRKNLTKNAIPVTVTTDALVHALTHARPKARYTLGIDSKLSLYAQMWLPARLLDAVL